MAQVTRQNQEAQRKLRSKQQQKHQLDRKARRPNAPASDGPAYDRGESGEASYDAAAPGATYDQGDSNEQVYDNTGNMDNDDDEGDETFGFH